MLAALRGWTVVAGFHRFAPVDGRGGRHHVIVILVVLSRLST